MVNIIIIGMGNPLRGDDGAGWAVIDKLENRVPASLCKLKGDIAELLDLFAHYSTVYIVDACCTDAPPGSWQRLDALQEALPAESQTSTHGFGLAQAIALAKSLDELPAKLIIYAISGRHYSMQEGLSEPVAASIEKVAHALLNEEDLCTKKA